MQDNKAVSTATSTPSNEPAALAIKYPKIFNCPPETLNKQTQQETVA